MLHLCHAGRRLLLFSIWSQLNEKQHWFTGKARPPRTLSGPPSSSVRWSSGIGRQLKGVPQAQQHGQDLLQAGMPPHASFLICSIRHHMSALLSHLSAQKFEH